MLRAERLGLTHAGDVPSWEDLTRTRAECVVCTYLVATRKLPTTSTRHSSVPTQTRALRESTGATYRRWLRCGGMAAESPAPAMSCRHTDQMCCSDMLHIFRYRLVAAARMPTVRSSADTRINTARERYFGRRRTSPHRVYVAAARMLTVQSSADTRTNTAREKYLGPLRGRSPRRVYGWQKRARKTKPHSVHKTNHQNLHNFIRRP